MMSDEQLMLEFKQGSEAAFLELFARYREKMYGFFRRRIENAARAEELAQEMFLAVLRAAERYAPRAPVRSYFYGIAMKLLFAERRRLSREAADASGRADPPAINGPESVVAVRQALSKLPSDERQILLLREYDQLSYGEIAEALGIPINTVKSRLFRARVALKELLLSRPKVLGG
jgi:RNA polymerase sigma-70 factor, ECF subfamily